MIDLSTIIYWFITLTLGVLLSYGTIKMIKAWVTANMNRPYNPPPQLFVNEQNEWDSKPGSQRLAWWRTFLTELVK